MNEREQSGQEYYKIPKTSARRMLGYSGVVAVSVLGTALVLNMLGGGKPAETKPAESSPTPTPTELIATPKPSEATGATPTPEVSIEPSQPSEPTPKYNVIDGDSIPAGQSRELPANTVVVGDAKKINGEKWTDSDASTGLVTILIESAKVEAGTGYKTDYLTVEDLEQAKYLAAQIQKDFIDTGCEDGNGCESVDALLFPGEKQGIQQSLDLSQYSQ